MTTDDIDNSMMELPEIPEIPEISEIPFFWLGHILSAGNAD